MSLALLLPVVVSFHTLLVSHGRMLKCLKNVRSIHEKQHGAAATNAALPAESSVGMHKLKGKVGIGDNAANAQKCLRVEVSALVKEASKVHMGENAWNALPEDAQEASGKIYGANCHRHLGNTWLDGGAKAEQKMLDALIPETDIAAARYLRCTTDVNKLIHAYSKGLGEGQNRYGKGFGEAKRAMLQEECAEALYMTVQRTDKGTRMDSCTEAAFDMYNNRMYDVQALGIAFYTNGNVLRDNLLVMLCSLPFVGCLRARALIHDKFTVRHRFFSASNSLEHWSVLDMAPVSDCSRAFFLLCAQDPESVATEQYDAFESLRSETPEYVAFLEKLQNTKKMSVDGKTEILAWVAVRKEIYQPAEKDNIACQDVFLKAVKAWGNGMLGRLDNGWGKTYIRGGDYGVDQQTPEMKVAMQDTWRNTNTVEGTYGALKMYGALFDNLSPANASAVMVSSQDHVFQRPALKHQHSGKRRVSDDAACSGTLKRRRKEATNEGRLGEFSREVRGSLATAMRMGRKQFQQEARDRHEKALAAHRARDKEAVKNGLRKLVKAYLKAKNSFASAPIVSDSELVGRMTVKTLEKRVVGNLQQQHSGNVRSRVLKENIERYVFGMGFSQFDPGHFTSSDPQSEKGQAGSEKNVTFLTAALIDIYDVVKKEKISLPANAVVPEMQTRKLPVIGEPTLQRVELQKGQEVSSEELERLVAEQLIAPRRSRARARVTKMPEITTELIGLEVDVAWNVTYNLAGGGQTTNVYWCPGTIEHISNDETERDGKNLGDGWLFVAYKDGDSGWIVANERWRWDTSKAGSIRRQQEEDDERDSDSEEETVDAGASDEDDD